MLTPARAPGADHDQDQHGARGSTFVRPRRLGREEDVPRRQLPVHVTGGEVVAPEPDVADTTTNDPPQVDLTRTPVREDRRTATAG